MIVRKLRLEKGWSQEQLAEASGVSVRTIQRMERGKRVGLETLKCLAAVFETDVNTLQPEINMTTTDQGQLTEQERDAMVHVRDIKAFYAHLISYIIVMPILALVNFYYFPEQLWVIWSAVGWGCGVACHGLAVHEVFGFHGVAWERRQIEKLLNR